MSSGPRSFNLVTLILLLGVAGGGYCLWKFFPVYFTAWQVDSILSEAATRSYKISRLSEPGQSRAKHDLEEELRKRVVDLGVTDPEMSLRIEIGDGKAVATCDYGVVVEHPVQGKVTEIALHRHAQTTLEKVDWESQEGGRGLISGCHAKVGG